MKYIRLSSDTTRKWHIITPIGNALWCGRKSKIPLVDMGKPPTLSHVCQACYTRYIEWTE